MWCSPTAAPSPSIWLRSSRIKEAATLSKCIHFLQPKYLKGFAFYIEKGHIYHKELWKTTGCNRQKTVFINFQGKTYFLIPLGQDFWAALQKYTITFIKKANVLGESCVFYLNKCSIQHSKGWKWKKYRKRIENKVDPEKWGWEKLETRRSFGVITTCSGGDVDRYLDGDSLQFTNQNLDSWIEPQSLLFNVMFVAICVFF